MSESIPQSYSDNLMADVLAAEPDLQEAEAPATRSRLPFSFASSNGVMIEEGRLVHIAGLSLKTLREIRRYMGRPLEMEELPENEFKARLTKLYQSSDNEAQQAVEDMDADFDLTALAEDIDDGELLSGEGDAPVIRLINAILSQAVQEKASDIHVEPYEDRVSVRFRIDGVLKEVLSPKPALAPVLVSRLKVMARVGYRGKACAAGWPDYRQACRPRRGPAGFNHALGARRARGVTYPRPGSWRHLSRSAKHARAGAHQF